MSLAELDELVQRAVDEGQAPGIVSAIDDGEAVHVACAGVQTIGGAPMRRDTLVRIASITKPITAVAALTLVDDGALALDDAVDRWLPELADRRVLRRPDGPVDDTVPARRPITVRDLLTNTAGFGMQGAVFMSDSQWPIHVATVERGLYTFGPPEPAVMVDPDTWLARFAALPLMAQPGERWLYQTSSQILGVLVARAAGLLLPIVFRERIFDPLGMADTSFWTTELDRLATAYERKDGDLVVLDPPDGQWAQPPVFPDGAAGLVSSVDDLLAFGRMLLRRGAPVLRNDTVAQMTRNQLTDAQRAFWPGFDMLSGRGWGYGLSVFDDGRYSWDGGLGTAWSNVPSRNACIVTLTQRAWDETGPPPICEDVVALACG